MCVASDRVRAAIRVFDGFARVGDAEFVLVLSGLGADRARAIADETMKFTRDIVGFVRKR